MNFDLESLRRIFEDKRLHICLAKVVKVAVASDRSVARCEVEIFPELRRNIARIAWPMTGPDAGIMSLPVSNDLVLVAMVEGSDEDSFVINRLTSKEDKIPLRAVDGDLVVKALTGKKVWLTSGDKIYLSKGDSAPTEPLVLGNIFKQAMSQFMEKYIAHTHIGNMGYNTAPPDNASAVSSIKSSPIDDGAVLSDLSFTEK